MKKTLVGTIYGLASWENELEYPNAKSKLPMGCVVRVWPIERLAIIYHCNKCDKVKKEVKSKEKKQSN